jgi:glycosyltransferase involved in cell wall biosynthesis
MKNNVFFSIVITTYNSSKYILKTNRSLERQTYKNYEIIIVDDFSSDNTIELLKSKKLKIIENTNNFGGPGVGRNKGLEEANGDWIIFLDADDFWKKDALKIFQQNINKNTDINIFSFREIRKDFEKKKITKLNFKDYKKNYFFNMLIYGNQLSPSSTTISVKFLKKNNLKFSEDANFISIEDYDFWLKIVKIDDKIFYIKRYLAYYLIHSHNISKKKNHFENFIHLLESYQKNEKEPLRKILNTRIKLEKILYKKSLNHLIYFFGILNIFLISPVYLLKFIKYKYF